VKQLCRHNVRSLTCVAIFVGLGRLALAAALDSPPAPPANTTAGKSAAKEVSVADAQKWATALQRAVRVGDADTFNKLVDWDAFIETATALADNSAKLKAYRVGFAQGLRSAATSNKSGFGRAVIGAVERAGEYRPLHIHRESGRLRVLFRLIASNGALNYHDWFLGRSKEGEVVAVDCYVYLLGELYSQNLRRTFLPMARKQGGADLNALSGQEQEFVAHFDQFSGMGQYVHDKDWRQALDMYQRLPSSVQHSTPALTMRLMATQATSNAEYLATIDDFRKYHPNDAMIDLISIDAYILRRDYDKALDGIDRLDKSVGGDPYLKVLRGSVLAREKKYDAARTTFEKAVAQDPKLLRGYYALIDLSLLQHNFADTLKWLKQAESQGVKFGGMKGSPAFAEFMKSPEYESWAKSHNLKD
jgi:tetratricopeptide (TPR) repeat protein